VLHISTRGEAPAIGFNDALLTGLARDGGLYLPQSYPQIDAQTIAGYAGRPYAEVARDVLGRLVDGEIADDAFTAMVEGAYAGFRHPATCPLVQIGDNLFVLELFHGPTLAFKDVAMQLLARLMDHVLKGAASAPPSSAPPPGIPVRRRWKRFPGSTRSISSSSIRMAASRKSSVAR